MLPWHFRCGAVTLCNLTFLDAGRHWSKASRNHCYALLPNQRQVIFGYCEGVSRARDVDCGDWETALPQTRWLLHKAQICESPKFKCTRFCNVRCEIEIFYEKVRFFTLTDKMQSTEKSLPKLLRFFLDCLLRFAACCGAIPFATLSETTTLCWMTI